MGMAAAQARLLQLQSRQTDDNFAENFFNNQKTSLSRELDSLQQSYSNSTTVDLDTTKVGIDSKIKEIEDVVAISEKAFAMFANDTTTTQQAAPASVKANPAMQKALAAYAKQV